MKLLIAEDDAVTRDLLDQYFREWGYDVICCSNGSEALHALSQEDSPRLAVLDWVMPVMTGVDVCRELRKSNEHSYVYVILLTGKRQHEDLVKGFEAGADDYIIKPFDPYELKLRINGGKRIVELQEGYRREIERRRVAETDLQEIRNQLEQMVLERTAELNYSNSKLMEEISHRRDAEEALRESEELYRDLFEKALDIIYTYDLEANFLSVNSAVERILGYTPKEFVSLSWTDIVDASFLEAAKQRIGNQRTGIEDGKPYELLVKPKAGDQVWLEVTSRIMRKFGKPLGVQSTARNITARKRAQEEVRKSFTKLARALEQTTMALSTVVEKRDPYTAGHQRRVAKLSQAIAKEMNLSDGSLRGLQVAGILHDLGKMNVPSEILTKPGRLNEIEFAMIKTHSQVGYDILKGIEFPWPIADIVVQHHERMDGSGYPAGLQGGDILVEARILAVADVVESMSSHRPYRPAFSMEMTKDEILKFRGKLYDSDTVDACIRVVDSGFSLDN
jgi:PAS domain S-box-containing protein/putative nucleotidyltransferase with HDIG domain